MKIKLILTSIIIVYSFVSKAQNLALTFNNAEITNDGTNDYYEVDVFATRISAADFKLGDGQFYLDYNPLAFGNSIGDATVDFDYTPSSILAEVNVIGVYGNPIINSNTATTVSIAWAQTLSAGSMAAENITETPTLLGHLKIQMIDVSVTPDLCFNVTGNSFDDQFYTACGPFTTGFAIKDCTGVNAGIQIFDYDGSDCSGGLLSCLDSAVWTAGGWDISPLVPTTQTNVTILSDYNTSIVGASIDACQLTIDSNASVIVAPGDYIKVAGDIVVHSGSMLTVEHTGSVVQTNDNGAAINDGTINVLLDTPNLASRDFMILGSPMTGETRTSVWGAAFLVLDATTANFVPHPQVAIDFPGAENFADDNNDFWQSYIGAQPILPGIGYLVRPQAGYGQPGGVFNYTYADGTLNTGNVDFSVGFNTPGPTAADNKNASPNVLANPYPSAIFADDFINGNTMVDEVYFWEHLTPPSPLLPGAGSMNFSMEDISMYNLSGGVGAGNPEVIATRPNGYIATGQGFGIKATAAGTATFTNAMRRTDNNNTLRIPINKDRLWLNIENIDYEMGGATLLAFNGNATAAKDKGYDSRRLATVVSLYSHLEDGSEQLGIQTREAFESGIRVPIGFSSQLDKTLTYKIFISTIEGENLEGSTVYLIDHIENTVTNLSETSYAFTSGKGTFHNRFTLFFQSEVLDVNDLLQSKVTVFPNPAKTIVNIISPDNNIESVQIYDVSGRLIKWTVFSSEENYQINISSFTSATYFLKINTSNGNVIKRLVKE